MATDLEPLQEENGAALEGGAWTEHLGFNVAVVDQEKDLKYIPNWRADHVIEGLKDLARAGGYSVLSLCGSVAVLKRFDHQVKLAHCYRAPGDKLYVWAPAPDHLPPPPPEVSTFATMCDDLRTHLRLTGTNVQVLAAACPQLGVAETSGTREERAARCRAILLGGPPPPAAAPDAPDARPDADAAATDLRVRVSCPAGASAGDVVTTTLPDGRSIRAPIPAGLAPGEAFTIRVRALPGSTDEEVRNLPVSLENGRRGDVRVVGNVVQGPEVVATEEEGCHVEVEAPPGRLGLRFETGTGHQVTSVAHSSPLAGRVSVGDRLVSIRAPGREFYCGSLRTGSDIVAEFQATAGSERVLTFARGGNVGSVAAQPGHSSPPSHAFPDARSFAGCFCTCFPCFPFVPFSCEKIISHDSNSYQAKGWTIMFLPIHIFLVPIPLCWDLHLARKHGNTFEVTTRCAHGNTHDWTSADGFRSGCFCCPTGRCSLGAARRGCGGIYVAACAGGLLQVLLCPLLCLRGVTCDGGSVVHGCVGGCC